MYLRKTYACGDYIIVKKYHRGPMRKGGRSGRQNRSTEAMASYNAKQRSGRLQRLILANFREGDFHMTLSYKMENRPESMAEAKRILQKFNRQMRSACRRYGREWKAIYVTERGSRGACHHHLIVENFPEVMQMVQLFWTQGHADYKPLYADGAFHQLASYLVKKETKEENDGCSYSHTRNLIEPKPVTEQMPAAGWRPEPKPVKGFEILKDTIENGENPYTGLPYQEYIMRRIKDDIQTGKGRRGRRVGILQSDKSLGVLRTAAEEKTPWM